VNWRLSNAALDDLGEIVAYIARDNPRAADAWVVRILEQVEKACIQPNGGRVVPERKDPKIREVFLRSYRIIYQIEPDFLLVLRVIEGHRRLRSV
jgi:plasmid stabilization system protein ParE